MAEHVWAERYDLQGLLVLLVCAECAAEIVPVVLIVPAGEEGEVRAELAPGREVWGMDHLPAGHRELMWGRELARITGQPPCTSREIESGR
jgi:hypothetical protein